MVDGSRSRSGKAGGIGVGSGFAQGSFWRKEERRLHERSSAKSLFTPAMCETDSMIWYSASIKNKHLRRCMSCGSLFVRDLITSVTAWLSQYPCTRLPRKWVAHTTKETMTANSSLKAIAL